MISETTPRPDVPAEEQPVFLKRAEVEKRVGLARSQIYARMEAGTFPKAVPDIDTRTVWWIESEIEAWLQARIANRNRSMGKRMGTSGHKSKAPDKSGACS